ncbi:hypothetical protein Q9S36_20375 [Microbacterium sp. ARD31]|jgi:hypothetical protein|uniref:hypothetical protein n=1 Tax=Microbacterium sp. ARD31 TaxID=2962576 RepID=UPI002880FDA2|nr:hypothetical protein [Microbacterium sp. ARD31]MDT0182534.1 hypothetical protein [Microbacterium sp. ARD31]
MAAAPAPFDARPLTEPVDKQAVRAFAHEMKRTGRAPSTSPLSIVIISIAGVFFLSVFGSVFASIFGAFIVAGDSGPRAMFAVIPFILILAVIAMVAVAIVRGFGGQSERWYRLDRFARANAMSYVPAFTNPDLPGMIFSIGSSRRSSDLVRGERPRFVEFGNYRYTTGSGKNRTTHKWGYVAVKLDVPLPHIVLDATGNNGLFGSNLPATFQKDQRLSLEGDFDRYFALYCPAGYERDALYLFTPDIMARFIDNAAALDVEIVDDWLFLYAKRDFSTLDPRTWAWLFSVVGALLDKLAQWARWRDDRLRADAARAASASVHGAEVAPAAQAGHDSVPFTPPLEQLRPPPGVATPGRRLQKGVPWVAIVIGVVVVGVWLLQFFGGFVSMLFDR